MGGGGGGGSALWLKERVCSCMECIYVNISQCFPCSLKPVRFCRVLVHVPVADLPGRSFAEPTVKASHAKGAVLFSLMVFTATETVIKAY